MITPDISLKVRDAGRNKLKELLGDRYKSFNEQILQTGVTIDEKGLLFLIESNKELPELEEIHDNSFDVVINGVNTTVRFKCSLTEMEIQTYSF